MEPINNNFHCRYSEITTINNTLVQQYKNTIEKTTSSVLIPDQDPTPRSSIKNRHSDYCLVDY